MFNVKRFDFDEEKPVAKSTDRDGGRLARAKIIADAETSRLEQLHHRASERRLQQQELHTKLEQQHKIQLEAEESLAGKRPHKRARDATSGKEFEKNPDGTRKKTKKLPTTVRSSSFSNC